MGAAREEENVEARKRRDKVLKNFILFGDEEEWM